MDEAIPKTDARNTKEFFIARLKRCKVALTAIPEDPQARETKLISYACSRIGKKFNSFFTQIPDVEGAWVAAPRKSPATSNSH